MISRDYLFTDPYLCCYVFKGMNMLKIAIASLFTKNKKYAAAVKIKGYHRPGIR